MKARAHEQKATATTTISMTSARDLLFPPRSLTASSRGRLLLFGLLYFVQGALFAYVLVFNNLYLRAHGGTGLQLAWLNGLLVVPFVLKIVFGFVSDRRSLLGRGHRVPYMALGLGLTAIGLLLASFVAPVAQFRLFVTLALFIALGMALFDTVTDGLAVDVTPAGERGRVQGSMVLGRSLGLVLLAGGYGRLIATAGWQPVFWLAAGLCLGSLAVLVFVAEPAQPRPERFDWGILRGLAQPRLLWLAAFAVVYSFVVYGANAIVTLFANEGLGATLVQVGDAAALSGLGMLLGGALLLALDRRWPIAGQGAWVTLLVSAALLAIAVGGSLENVMLLTVLWGVCLAAMELVFVTLAMRSAAPGLAAGTFALFMAVSNIGTGLGQATTTGLIDVVDYRWLFAALGLLNLLCLPLLRRLSVKASERQGI
jgi:PAT family beta-lactamase induction signal transducer AmpG